MDDVKRRIMCLGMLFHSFMSAAPSSWRVVGFGRRFLTLLPSSSHTCSIGDKSGDFDGQPSTLTLFWARNVLVSPAVCGVALSCWNVRPGPLARRNGITTGLRISSLYRWADRFPSMMTSRVRRTPHIPPQTMTLPPPNRSTSDTQHPEYRSPRRLHTLVLPSANFKQNRDSSLKRTRDQSIWRKRMWRWAQLCRLRLCWSVNSVPLYGRRALIPEFFKTVPYGLCTDTPS